MTWAVDAGRLRVSKRLSQRNVMANLISLLAAITIINQAIGRPKADNEQSYAVSHNAS